MTSADLARVDRALTRLARAPVGMRDEGWQGEVDALLARRSVLMADRDRGFRIRDRRKVRG